MAPEHELPCDSDGLCMLCKKTPPDDHKVICKTCVTPWHLQCLRNQPENLSDLLHWECPDCSCSSPVPFIAGKLEGSVLIASIREIQNDSTLTEQDKAKKRQELMSKNTGSRHVDEKEMEKSVGNDVFEILDGSFNCSFCMQLPERPVTTPCGHNFCLKCFQKWTGQGKLNCAKCRAAIPQKMASQPRINSALVVAIRMAKTAKFPPQGPPKVYHFMHNENRPDKCFTTDRAKKTGKANACSGKIFVTVPPDHFGPIPAENDPSRNQGVLVGECWEDRMECRQWGAHLPHVAGIAGQSDYGAQSVALSGGYEDDEDHGEWFLYTGSGGRDLSGNKRTNKEQSFDQKFEKLNEALRASCKKGYPVRVVRSHKEKRSSYAPETGVRYDGVYRIEKCWRKVGIQGFKVCRYLFVRCDNEPAPWTSDEHGDRPRPLPSISELKKATDITERKGSPAWDWDEEKGWKWVKPPPLSQKPVGDARNPGCRTTRKSQSISVRQKLLKEFSCQICKKVMSQPLTTPCAHNFCKACLDGAFAGQKYMRERSVEGGRSLRAQKIIKKCPSCQTDISDFLHNPQINRELMDVIETLQRKSEEEEAGESKEEANDEKEETTIESTDEAIETNTDAEETFEVDGKNETDSGDLKDSGKSLALANANEILLKGKRKGTKAASCATIPKKKAKKSKRSEVEEGNSSPLSPLLLRSDGDFE